WRTAAGKAGFCGLTCNDLLRRTMGRALGRVASITNFERLGIASNLPALLNDVCELVGQEHRARARAQRVVTLAKDDVRADGEGAGADRTCGGGSFGPNMNAHVGEVESEERLHSRACRGGQRLPWRFQHVGDACAWPYRHG